MQRQITVNVSLPEDLSDALGAYSKAHKCSKAHALAAIAAEHLESFRADVREGIS